MSVNLTINAATYPFPSGTDTDWGDDATTAIQALALYALYEGDLDTDGTLAANSDTKIATQKATKTYADTKVAKSLYDANSILAANSDDTPAALTVAASTIVGRKATGNIVAMTAAETSKVLYTSTIKSVTTADYIITDTDGYDTVILGGAADADRTLTLPTAADNVGRKIKIINNDATYKITVDGESSEKIQGVNTIDIDKQYAGIEIVCDGTEWFVINCTNCELLTVGSAVELSFYKYFTGTTDADSQTIILHGLDWTKIINVISTIQNTSNSFFYTAADSVYFNCAFDGGSIYLSVPTAGFQGNAYRLIVKYYV